MMRVLVVIWVCFVSMAICLISRPKIDTDIEMSEVVHAEQASQQNMDKQTIEIDCSL